MLVPESFAIYQISRRVFLATALKRYISMSFSLGASNDTG